MSFNTVLKDAPASAPAAQAPMTSRDRAIAAFKGAQATQPPITEHALGNTSNISPENASAVIPPTSQNSITEASPEKAAQETVATDNATQATPDPKSAQLAAKYAQLARQEKAFRKAQADFKAQQAAFKAQQDALQQQA